MDKSQEASVLDFADQTAVCSILVFVTCWSFLVPVFEPRGQVQALLAGCFCWGMEVGIVDILCF